MKPFDPCKRKRERMPEKVSVKERYPTLLESMTDHSNRVAGVYVAGMASFMVGMAAMVMGGVFALQGLTDAGKYLITTGVTLFGVGQLRSAVENAAASMAQAKTGVPTASASVLPSASATPALPLPPPPQPFASPSVALELPPPSPSLPPPPSPIPPLPPSLGLPSAPSLAGQSSPRLGTLSLPATSEGKEGAGSAVMSSPLAAVRGGAG